MRRFGTIPGLLIAGLLLCGCAATPGDAPPGAAAPPVAAQEADLAQLGDLRLSEFVFGPGDKLEITVYRHDDLKRSMVVDLSGRIMFPLVGDLQAAGKTVFALRDELTGRLSRYLVNPAVTIEVTEVLSRRIMVLGKVSSPGYFVLETEVTALDALAKAGGATDEANLSKVLVVRQAGERKVELYLDLKKALAGEDHAANVAMRNGDIMFVPSTRIANISRYASYFGNILAPIVSLEGGIVLWPLVKDAIKGKGQDSQVTIPTQ